MAAAAKAPPPRQPRRNFAACAILVASLLAACTAWPSTGARIAEQSLIRFGLPIDTLKVSGSFVRQVFSNSQDVALVTGLRALGQTLGRRVGCEGIETLEQLTFIERTRQWDGMRGFVVSKPVEDWSKLGGVA
jgi:predicted signal transduction protein with EAL and GGDEF domain